MFDRLIRYLPVLDYIRKYKPKRILEVGSSSKGIGEFYSGQFTGVDMDFPEKPVSNMKAVVGSVEKLPFSDREFDLVFSVDMFEHIPEKMRKKALEEMVRVCFGKKLLITNDKLLMKKRNSGETVKQCDSKTVMIGYPCGEGAERLSRKMLDWFESRHSGTARWMREHVEMGLPSEEILTNTNQKNINIRKNPLEIRGNRLQDRFRIHEFGNENLKVCELLLKLEENGRILRVERYILTHFRSELESILRRLNFRKCYRKFWMISS